MTTIARMRACMARRVQGHDTHSDGIVVNSIWTGKELAAGRLLLVEELALNKLRPRERVRRPRFLRAYVRVHSSILR